MDSGFNTVDKSHPQLRETYLAIGLSLSIWAKIEENLCHIFMRVAGIDYWGTAFEMFFSLSGSGQRISFVESCLKFPHCSADWASGALAITKYIKNEVPVRNKIVHGFHLAFADTVGSIVANHRDIMNGNQGLSANDIASWATYIEKLNRLTYLFNIEFDKGDFSIFCNDLDEFRGVDRPAL